MSDLDLERLRSVARRAALRGGEIVSGGRRTSGGTATSKELPGDWVTEVDVASERAIGSLLAAETPDVPVQGEEAGGVTSGLR